MFGGGGCCGDDGWDSEGKKERKRRETCLLSFICNCLNVEMNDDDDDDQGMMEVRERGEGK